MNPWLPWLVLLAGVNLVRLRRRNLTWGLLAVLVVAVTGLTGGLGASWPRWAGAALTAGVVPTVWGAWSLNGRRPLPVLGLVVFGLGVAMMTWLLPVTVPMSASTWLWAGALLLLAEPANRLLRVSLGLVGKPVAEAGEALGRGEAIGVLERWIALIMVARGDYAALGFLMAAKALARHKRFEDDPEFAEYFLVGTLGSVLAAIAVAEGMRLLTAVP